MTRLLQKGLTWNDLCPHESKDLFSLGHIFFVPEFLLEGWSLRLGG
jgi:hypothetical protein